MGAPHVCDATKHLEELSDAFVSGVLRNVFLFVCERPKERES